MFNLLIEILRKENGSDSALRNWNLLANLSAYDSKNDRVSVIIENNELHFHRQYDPVIVLTKDDDFRIINNEVQLSVGNCIYFSVKFYSSRILIELNKHLLDMQLTEHEAAIIESHEVLPAIKPKLTKKEKFNRLVNFLNDNPGIIFINDNGSRSSFTINNFGIIIYDADCTIRKDTKIKITKSGKLKVYSQQSGIPLVFEISQTKHTNILKGLFE